VKLGVVVTPLELSGLAGSSGPTGNSLKSDGSGGGPKPSADAPAPHSPQRCARGVTPACDLSVHAPRLGSVGFDFCADVSASAKPSAADAPDAALGRSTGRL